VDPSTLAALSDHRSLDDIILAHENDHEDDEEYSDSDAQSYDDPMDDASSDEDEGMGTKKLKQKMRSS